MQLALPPRKPGLPAYQWLYEALRRQILEGRLRPGARLPGTRDLASQYGLSRGTIVNAFEQLATEGYIEGSVGSGTFVSATLPDELLEAGRQSRTSRASRAHPKRVLSEYARRIRPLRMTETPRLRAFRTDVPALDLFPTTLWAQVAARRQRRLSVKLLLGCEPMGYRPLREAIADYLTTSRGVRCSADQIAIVSGVQEALDRVARLFLDVGDRACTEDPGYPGAAAVFESVGANVVALPIDDEGMEVREREMRNARIVYVTPAHQFPVGTAMTLGRRLTLLEWAQKSGALIFEDDYDSEFRYSGRPLPALQGLDPHGVVLFTGGFSKVLFPSLRLAYLVVPEDLVPLLNASMSTTIRHPPVPEQAVLCDFITEGHFGRHLRRMRQIYGGRLTVLLEEGRRHLSGLLDISDVEAGLQTPGWLREGIDDVAAAKAAAARDVDVTPISQYSRRKTRPGLQLAFAAVDEAEIRRGVKELAIALSRRASS
jgi:GntR family transcriptional regulator / MocR family aminotransferase